MPKNGWSLVLVAVYSPLNKQTLSEYRPHWSLFQHAIESEKHQYE
jgi:hypothetical protein